MNRTHLTSIASLAALLLVASFTSVSTAEAQSRTFSVQDGTRVQFVSDAPLETMTGHARGMTGSFQMDPSDLSSVSGTLSIPVRNLRTGIDLRDEHLRSDNWLDAQSHPNITLELTSMEGASRLTPNEATSVRMRGRLSVHGVERPVTVRASITWSPADNRIRASARFTVNLTQHNISVPAVVRLKVANEIAVTVRLAAESS